MSLYVHLCIYAIALCWLSSSHIDRWRVCVCGSWHIQTHHCPLEGAQSFNH